MPPTLKTTTEEDRKMKYCIEGTLGENRELTFEDKRVYCGEHNCAELKIPVAYWENDNIDYYELCLEPSPFDKRIRITGIDGPLCSPARLEGGFIYCPLTAKMTRGGRLKVQVTACKTEGNTEAREKSGVGVLDFEPSVPADGAPAGEEETIACLPALLRRLEELENPDYGYIAACACAHLIYRDGETTPLHFPADNTELQAVLSEALADYEPGSGVRHIVVSPERGGHGLIFIAGETGESAGITALRGREIAEYIIEEAAV